MDSLPLPPFRVLVVCRANVCRSPLAHAVLAARLGPVADVRSAGTSAAVGAPPCAHVVDALGDEAHALPAAARQLTREDVLDADLVLGADRATCSEIIALAPTARQRVLTLRELPAVAAVALETVEPVDAYALVAALTGARAEAWRRSMTAAEHRSGLGRLFGSRRAPDPAQRDLADGHTIDARSHRATIVTGLVTARAAAHPLGGVLEPAA
jgi:protein-tyrosine phosphatase